jgi:Uma2 family endonuclease
MIAIPEQPQKMTIEEYLEWEPLQDVRYEYVNGEVFAMTGGTIPHNDIALNLYRALYPHLRSRGCRANVSDVKVQVSPKSPYYYPDVIVSCDPQDLKAPNFIQSPKLIAEVLSPGTSAKDRGEKFTYYTSNLCRPIVAKHSRRVDGLCLYMRDFQDTVGEFQKPNPPAPFPTREGGA